MTACRVFQHRFQSFLTSVILSPANPNGKVTDHFFRVEFQARGWPHIHALFWCSDSPKFDRNSNNEELCKYVDTYLSCSLPDSSHDPVLSELVSTLQLHSMNYTKTCRKGKSNKKCRFNFPRPPSQRTFIAQPIGEIENEEEKLKYEESVKNVKSLLNAVNDNFSEKPLYSSESLQSDVEDSIKYTTKRNMIVYKRKINECWVNPYNPVLLEAWNGNMDIQPVLCPFSCIMYIVSYIAKNEREMGDLLKAAEREAKEGNCEPMQQLRKLGNVYLHHREVSIMESVYRATGMPLKNSSRQVIFLPSDSDTDKISKPISSLKKGNSSSIWMDSLYDKYLNRPTSRNFETMCFADFASLYSTSSGSYFGIENDSSDEEENEESATPVHALNNNMGFIKKRKTPAVIRYFKSNKHKNSEKYFQNIITVYFPHRKLNPTYYNCSTFTEMFSEKCDAIVPNMKRYETISEELDEAWQKRNESSCQDAWDELMPVAELERGETLRDKNALEGMEQNIETTEVFDVLNETNPHQTDQTNSHQQARIEVIRAERLKEMKVSLNDEQREFMLFIRTWAQKVAAGQDVESFNVFLTGGAGTGKSHLVRCIYEEVNKILPRLSTIPDSPVVLLLAPTGTAAYHIGGQTIHSALKIGRSVSKHLSEDLANTLRCTYQDLKLVIIDEISMVSTDLLQVVHHRLQQIKQPLQRNTFFGNVSILAVGDFYQVPPVKSHRLLSDVNSVSGLWNLFSLFELKEIVRQKNDSHFVQLLNRLRVKTKNEPLSSEDRETLMKRCISPSSGDYPHNALHLFSTNKDVDCYNSTMMSALSHEEQTTFSAVDVTTDTKTMKTVQRDSPLPKADASLQANLILCPEARVMLTANIDVADGLTNGALGKVSHFLKKNDAVVGVFITFDNSNVGKLNREKYKHNETLIKRHSEVICTSPSAITRYQFPLKLAWAVTIHKVQGLTTDKVVISLNNIFSSGMAYVALSRATTLSGIHILENSFSDKCIYADDKVSHGLQLMPLTKNQPFWGKSWIDFHYKDENFSVISINVRGLLPNINYIKDKNPWNQVSIIALQETWLNSDNSLQINGYNIVRKDRTSDTDRQKQNSNKGGVALFLHRDVKFDLVEKIPQVSVELIAIRIIQPVQLTLLNMYKPPSINNAQFSADVTSLLSCFKNENLLIVGDFNENLINVSSTIEKCDNRFSQLIKNPTTVYGTLLDHIYTRNVSDSVSGVLPQLFSDHFSTFIIVKDQL